MVRSAVKSEVLGEEGEAGRLRHLRARELEEVGQGLRDVEAAGEALLQARLELVEDVGSSMVTSFVGGSESQAARSPTSWSGRFWNPA